MTLAETALQQHARLLVDSVKDYAIFMLDPEGRVMTWNAGAKQIKGFEAHEIIGQHMSRFYTPEDRESGRPARLLRAAVSEGRVEDEGWRVRKGGSRFWADVVITRLIGADGQPVGFAKVTRDLTARKAAEDGLREREQNLRAMIESVRDHAIFMLDPLGRIVSWNSGAERVTGYSRHEIIGSNFSNLYPPEDIAAGRPEQKLREAQAAGHAEDEGWRVKKDGKTFWASAVISAIRDEKGTLLGFTKVTRDMTERRRMEEEVAVQRIVAAEARTAVKDRDEFISVAAHELRTPLTALQLKLQSIERGARKMPPQPGGIRDLHGRLESAVRQTERLSELVERLLDVSRIASGTLELRIEQVDLSELVLNVVQDFKDGADKRSSELRFQAESAVVGRWDKTRLEQVVTNLLSNAVKYGDSKPIDVRVGSRDGLATLVITDRGLGIAPADYLRIFGRFERAAPLSHYGGLGLGLYVTRYVVEAHGGTINVESDAERGTTFVIALPLDAEHPEVRQ